MGNPYCIEREAGREHGRARRRQVRAAEQRAAQQAAARPTQETAPAPPTYSGASAPASSAEAAQRFFARYGAIIGGDTWAAAQRHLRSRAPRPTTIEGWYAAAEAVRDHARAAAADAAGRFLFVADVLLHESIHQWHFEITGQNEDSYHGHGPAFAAVCTQLGAALGLPPVRSNQARQGQSPAFVRAVAAERAPGRVLPGRLQTRPGAGRRRRTWRRRG